jgi:fumarylacetoacetate (FAA) hydrolase
MRLGTLREGRDGSLIVVDRTGTGYVRAKAAPTLQAALDDWEHVEPVLRQQAAALDAGKFVPERLDIGALDAPLPRAYEWVDGSAYINHILLVRKARGAEPPPTLESEPLVYQGGSGKLLAARDAIELSDPSYGLDFEAEICVVLADTPREVPAARAGAYVRLLMLANDVTLRNLVPSELEKGFGFFLSKPATAFSAFAVTPDELGTAFRDGRVHLKLRSIYNHELVGDPDTGAEMHFSFYDLIAHITKTRAFTAGTILGSGTVSNADPMRGVSCLAERRMREVIEHGKPSTPFMSVGDTIRIEMRDLSGRDIFGAIDQQVVAP